MSNLLYEKDGKIISEIGTYATLDIPVINLIEAMNVNATKQNEIILVSAFLP